LLQLNSLSRLSQLPDALGPLEVVRVRRFIQVLGALRSERNALSAQDLLERALGGLGYRTAAAMGPHGDQVLANLDKLLERAQRRVLEGRGQVEAFASELRRLLAAPPREGPAELQDGTDPDAVQILTVHQAKGLEWPVVVLAELDARRFRPYRRVALERTRGIALRSCGPDPQAISPRFRHLQAALERRQDAEEVRLFYVALTRARDELILSGLPSNKRSSPRGWAGCVADLSEPPVAALCDAEPWADPFALTPVPPEPGPVEADPTELLQRALERTRPSSLPAPSPRLLPLAAWVDASDCPRRFHFRHREGAARPVDPEVEFGGALRAALASSGPPGSSVLGKWLQTSHAVLARRAQMEMGVRFQTHVGLERDPLQLQGTAALVWRTPEGERGLLGVSEALSSRGALLAHRFFEQAASALGGKGTAVRVQTVALRRGEVWDHADGGLARAEAEVTLVQLRAAAHALPPTLPMQSCRALGCEFLPRCHPAAQP
jgi:hypothetical protein